MLRSSFIFSFSRAISSRKSFITDRYCDMCIGVATNSLSTWNVKQQWHKQVLFHFIKFKMLTSYISVPLTLILREWDASMIRTSIFILRMKSHRESEATQSSTYPLKACSNQSTKCKNRNVSQGWRFHTLCYLTLCSIASRRFQCKLDQKSSAQLVSNQPAIVASRTFYYRQIF